MIDPARIDIKDIRNVADLIRIVEATYKPRLLKHDDTPIALLTPVKEEASPQTRKKAIKDVGTCRCLGRTGLE